MSPLTEPTKLTLAKGQPVPNDPHLYTNTVLLLHGDGANGSTNIVDSSRVAGGPKIVTPVGNAQISTAVADPFGNSTRGVLAFDGTGDYLSIQSSLDLRFGSSNFTIEMWVFRNAGTGGSLLSNTITWVPGSFNLTCGQPGTPSGTLQFWVNSYSLGTAFISGPILNLATWYHVAISRTASTGVTNMFVNGSLVGSATNAASIGDSGFFTPILCGATDNGAAQQFNGYIDELRITKGVARYTSNFTPPTAPFPDF